MKQKKGKRKDPGKNIQCTFQIQYHTAFGEAIQLIIKNAVAEKTYPMQYGENDFWHCEMEWKINEQTKFEIIYSYCFIGFDGEKKYEGGAWRTLEITGLQNKNIFIHDSWNDAGDLRNLYNTKIFQEYQHAGSGKLNAFNIKKNTTHAFIINIPFVPANKCISLVGSAAATGFWKILKKCILSRMHGNTYSVQLNLSVDDFPLEYKYVVFDKENLDEPIFEFDDNRLLKKMHEQEFHVVNDGFGKWNYPEKKGVGISIPVFSLRSENSGGVGEFNDLKLLGNWAAKTSSKLIQILPIHDTVTTNDWDDSYPYSAISAFALHPVYLNLPLMAGKKYKFIAEKFAARLHTLNALPEVNYPEVIKLKWEFFREIFPLQKKQIFALKSYKTFFEENAFWLEPYAAFCFLRDKYHSANFSEWPAYKKYTALSVKKLLKNNEGEISLYFFLQFHLHLQLMDVVNELHQKNIYLKADIPIGVKHDSVDHWQHPNLFNEDLLAGAPPDAFTQSGQNWGFPTYNWKSIKENNFSWWEEKLQHNSKYAAAIRLDHVLGFFRIWSIPKKNIQGILGFFQPAIALNENDFLQREIYFNEDRFCKPFITEFLLHELFVENAGYVKETFLEKNTQGLFDFKIAFDTEKKMQVFIDREENESFHKKLRSKLLHLYTEIILLKDAENGFHFRVNMQQTFSFNKLDEHLKNQLNHLYHVYFFDMQNELWKKNGSEILSALHKTTNMLYCGEDLGWVPDFVPGILKENGILSLDVQRMPKKSNTIFTDISSVHYLRVATPGTHDMPVLRAWWKQDKKITQAYYNDNLGMHGVAPEEANESIIKKILEQFLHSPAMWSIFQLQDIMGMDKGLQRDDPGKEQINNPADAHNKWNYRMHISLENLLQQNVFNETWKSMIAQSSRE